LISKSHFLTEQAGFNYIVIVIGGGGTGSGVNLSVGSVVALVIVVGSVSSCGGVCVFKKGNMV
jgi:hypothetical protein